MAVPLSGQMRVTALGLLFNAVRGAVSAAWRHGLLVNHHPVDAKLVAKLAETVRKEGLFHFHKDLAAFSKRSIDALRLFIAVNTQRKIRATHGLYALRRAIAGHHERVADLEARVENAFRLQAG